MSQKKEKGNTDFEGGAQFYVPIAEVVAPGEVGLDSEAMFTDVSEQVADQTSPFSRTALRNNEEDNDETAYEAANMNEFVVHVQDQDYTFQIRRNNLNNRAGISSSVVKSEKELAPDWLFAGRLLRVKGVGKNVLLKEKRCRRDSLNSGDVFILDTAVNVYIWIGKQANQYEIGTAKKFVASVNEARKNKLNIIILKEGENDRDVTSFWQKLPERRRIMGVEVGIGLKKLEVKSSQRARRDEQMKEFRKRLYRLSDGGLTGRLRFDLLSVGKIKHGNIVEHKKLDSRDVFMLDDGFILWVWIGKGSSEKEKRFAMTYAQEYLKKRSRPTILPIKRIEEDKEPAEFIEHFGHFRERNCAIS